MSTKSSCRATSSSQRRAQHFAGSSPGPWPRLGRDMRSRLPLVRAREPRLRRRMLGQHLANESVASSPYRLCRPKPSELVPRRPVKTKTQVDHDPVVRLYWDGRIGTGSRRWGLGLIGPPARRNVSARVRRLPRRGSNATSDDFCACRWSGRWARHRLPAARRGDEPHRRLGDPDRRARRLRPPDGPHRGRGCGPAPPRWPRQRSTTSGSH